MTATVKTGRKEGQVSSYNLFFSNGLRLKTEDLTWLTSTDRAAVQQQFDEVIAALLVAGIQIVGER